ncbi:hypothetical protein F5880DRAFT_1617700 [Lentinula raphanica]|nr:hypothetical protein F5880DRAFT_1617700 [Lentinula raphanica]
MRNDNKVGAYNIKFNTLAAASGWDVNALQWAYQKGLAPRLKDKIARMPKPQTLSKYWREVLWLDNRYWCREDERKWESHHFLKPSDQKKGKKDGKKPVPFNSSQNSGANQSSSSSNNQKKFSNSNNNKGNSGNKFPKKSIADNLGSDGKLTPAERERRGYVLKDCPRKKSKENAAKGRAGILKDVAEEEEIPDSPSEEPEK